MRRAADTAPRVIGDGAANMVERATQWAVVEAAQRALNDAAHQSSPEYLLHALAVEYGRAYCAWEGSARGWPFVAAAQEALNREAARLWREDAAVGPALLALEQAMDEYSRIGGNEDRMPGAGGLA